MRYRYDKASGKVVEVGETAYTTPFEINTEGDVRVAPSGLPFNWSVPKPGYEKQADSVSAAEGIERGYRIPLAPRYDKEGKPCFTSHREIRESIAKAQAHGEPVRYSRGFRNYG